MAHKAIKTISLSIGAGSSVSLLNATTGKGQSADLDEVAVYGDDEFTSIPRPVKHNSDYTFEVLDEGGADFTDSVGTVKTVSLTLVFDDGKGSSATKTISQDMAIVSVTHNEVSVDGERKAVATITARKHAPTAASQGGN